MCGAGTDLAGSRMGAFDGRLEEKCSRMSLHGSATSKTLEDKRGGVGELCLLKLN